MSLFDLSMKLKGVASQRRKLTGNILYDWEYNDSVSKDSDFNSLVNAYRGWVYIAASRNATSVAQVDLKLYAAKESKTQKIKSFSNKEVSPEVKNYIYKNTTSLQKTSLRQSKDMVEITDHPFLDLINNVNSFTNKFTLLEQTETFLSLVGNAYWYLVNNKIGLPAELWVLPPQNVRIIPDKTKFIKGYEYYKNGFFWNKQDGIFYKERDVVHFRMPSPTNYYYGVGHLAPVYDEVILGGQMNEFEKNLFKNGQTISGTWTTSETLGDHEWERLKNEISSLYNGNSNAGKNPVLDSGLQFTPFSYSKKDLSFFEGRQYVMEIVLASFGLSRSMLSHEATRSNAESGIQLYQETTLKPKLRRIEQKINEKILPRYSDKLFCAFDNPVTSDKEMDLKELRTWIELGMTTVDEQRSIRGYDKFNTESSDMAFKPVNMYPADLIMENFKNMPEQDKIDGVKNLIEAASKFDEIADKVNNG